MITGSYWPGDIYLFRGQADGTFAKRETLKAKDGKDLNAGPAWKSQKKPEMDSLAASPWLQDVDADGDLDLLVGNIAGRVVLIENEGDAKNPQFVRKAYVQAEGKDVNVANNDSGPTTVDWDGDGLWDLIVGGGDGSVSFFKNTGTKQAMQFAAGVELLGKNGTHSIKHGAEPTRSGSRAKVCVTDWNGDGRLDLLVGDFGSVEGPEKQLTDEQKAQRKELIAERDELSNKLQKYWQLEEPNAEQQAEMKPLQDRYTKVWQELRPLERANTMPGWVWVYLRKGAAAAQPPGNGMR